MNKHDELTVAARDMAGQENCDGPEYDMIIELTDLLQQYGDALLWLARKRNVTSTNGLEEVRGMGQYAQKTVEGE